LLDVAPEIPEVVKFLGGLDGIGQMVEGIEEYANRNLLPGKSHYRMGSGTQGLKQSHLSLPESERLNKNAKSLP
jgi:hypothetical protein